MSMIVFENSVPENISMTVTMLEISSKIIPIAVKHFPVMAFEYFHISSSFNESAVRNPKIRFLLGLQSKRSSPQINTVTGITKQRTIETMVSPVISVSSLY